MTTTILTSREFNHDTGRAKKAAARGPVFITDRGQPAHVLLTIDEYNRLAGVKSNLAEMLSMPGLSDIELDVERPRDTPRAADFS